MFKSQEIKPNIMKKYLLLILIIALSIFSSEVSAQATSDTTMLGLPGDNLDLYAVLEIFQKSKTIEDFEKTLNEEKTGINNLDLNLDKKVDFIKVTSKQKDKDFTFILQVDVTEKETQDVAVILVSKDKNDKVSMQIVGDPDLYGKNYVIEPKPAAPAVTANPGYSGSDPVIINAQPTTTVVVVESAPIVQYVYSPVYVPYYPPYHYAYYPPYYTAFTVMAVSVYRHNHYYYHAGYHGGYNNNTVIIHNTNNYNNYNNSRHTSNTVNHNNANGRYNGNRASTTQTKGSGSSTRPSATPSKNPSKGTSSANRPTTSPSTKQSTGSSSTRPTASPSAQPSRSSGSSTARPATTNGSRPSSGSYGGRGGGGRHR